MHSLADAYRRATLAGAWHGPSLAELLDRVTPPAAEYSAIAGGHSIRALLQHLLLWNERIRVVIEAESAMPRWEPDKEWAEPAVTWAELRKRWSASRDALEAAIRSFPQANLDAKVPGRDYSYALMLPGAVDHVIYHTGQIAMILAARR